MMWTALAMCAAVASAACALASAVTGDHLAAAAFTLLAAANITAARKARR
ncbi:hypothetical protein [Streptomyces sp. NPDC003278]